MCTHKKVAIIPTADNSWGIADTYQIKCMCCKQILHDNLSPEEVNNYLLQNKPVIIGGSGFS